MADAASPSSQQPDDVAAQQEAPELETIEIDEATAQKFGDLLAQHETFRQTLAADIRRAIEELLAARERTGAAERPQSRQQQERSGTSASTTAADRRARRRRIVFRW